ncbi:MAG: restriction endonuclease [Solirubrobacterales bacterium]
MQGSDDAYIPPHNEMMWPTLLAVRRLGHSAKLDEINDVVFGAEGFSEQQLAVLHKEGPRSEIEYRLAWARTYLKRIGLLDNPVRGTWVTTELGREVGKDDVERLWLANRERWAAAQREKRKAARAAGADPDLADEDGGDETEGWREELLQVLLAMDPTKFEHLAKRILRKAGFVEATVTGGSGDGGIDGVGVYQVSLVSFPVFFQCKRYKGSVGPDKVRDFRGAMQGRGDRGLLITTGSFTASAKREARRDGTSQIDLIDGERLCDLLKEHGLGVETTTRTIEDVRIRSEFFADPS